MSGVVERRDSGAWVPRGGDGQYKPTNRASVINAHGVTGKEGVVEVPLEPEDQPKIDVLGDAPAPSTPTTESE